MAKELKYNIKISVDGKEMVVASVREVGNLSKEINLARSSAQRFNDAMNNIANVGMALQGITGALGNISSTLNSVTEESRSFSAAMKAANTMAGKGADGFENLKDQVSELSKSIPLTRDALANGLYQVISNGVPEDNWIDYLNASSRAAVGGIADVGEVVKVTSTVIKNYGLEWSAAQDIQDKIQLTAKNGVTSFEQLAAALPSVTGQAAQLGVSFTEMLAVMSTLTGVTGNTSEVATQLGSVLTALTKESSKAQKMASAMGIEFNAASIKAAGGLQNFLIQLDQTITAYAQKTGQLKESIYAQLFGRAEALRLTNALTGELAGKFSENINALENSAGTIDEAFKEMSSTGSATMQMWKNGTAYIGDFIESMTSGIGPILTFGSQAGTTALSVIMLSKSFKELNVAQRSNILLSKVSAISTLAQAAASKVSAVATALWANQVRFANRMQIAWTFGAKRFVIQAVAMRVAIMGLMAITGVGLAIMAVSSILSAITGKASDATKSLEGLNDAQQNAKNSAESLESVYQTTLSNTYSELIGKFDQLKAAWKSLSTEQQKTAWIKKNQSEFENLKLSVNNVTDAENLFERNTDAVVEAFNRRAKAAAYAAQLTELYKRQIELSQKAEKVSNDIREDARKTGRSAKAGDEITDQTFRSSRYGSVDRSGTWRFSEQGARLYSGQDASTSKAVTEIDQQIKENNQRIEDTLEAMRKENEAPSLKTSPEPTTPTTTTETSTTTPKQPAAEGSYDWYTERIQALRKQVQAASSETVASGLQSDLEALEREFSEFKVRVGIEKPDEAEVDELINPEVSVREAKRQDYDNAGQQAQTIQQDYEIGIIGKDEALEEIAQINLMLEKLGLQPIEIPIMTDDIDKAKEKFKGTMDAVNQMGSSLSSLGSAIGVPELDIAGTIAQAIATMTAGYATATTQAATLGPWAWIAFAATGLAQLAMMISSVKGLQGFATGGIVGGTTKSGDRQLIRANSGEMLLTTQQQANLFRMLNSGYDTRPRSYVPELDFRALMANRRPTAEEMFKKVKFEVEGRKLTGVLSNDTRIRARSGHRSGIKV